MRLGAIVAAGLVAPIVSSAAVVNARGHQSDFTLAGTWTLTSDLRNVGPLGRQVTITQDSEFITFVNGDRVMTHRLDGGPSTYTTKGSRFTSTHRSEAHWVNSALVIRVETVAPIGAWEDLVVCSVDSEGQLNVVHVATQKRGGMGTRVHTYRRTTPG